MAIRTDPPLMSERRKHLEFLRKTAKDAIWSGDYERALTLYEDGLALARSWKDRELEDLFTCNRATTLLEMDRQDFDLSGLKEIVLRSPASPNGVLAAYASAHAHEVRGEYVKASFYAQSALQKSRDLRLEDWTAASLNLLANLELHESRFVEAHSLFQEALEGFDAKGQSQSREAAVISDNLGYCHIALDAVPVGLPLVYRSLSLLESLGSRQAMDYPCLDLCFASLKMNRAEEAESWGVRALGLGKEFGRNDVVKNAHYLLAETYSETRPRRRGGRALRGAGELLPEFPGVEELPPSDQPDGHDQSEGMMRRHGIARLFVLAVALAGLPAMSLAIEEQSLLTADGTLHVVRAGRVVDLGIQDAALSPEDIVIEWASRAQDGTLSVSIIPGTESRGDKRGLQAAFDEQTQTLLLLWTEDISAFSEIRVAVRHAGVWTNSGLLPNQGISRAFNPQMGVTHQAVSYLDETGRSGFEDELDPLHHLVGGSPVRTGPPRVPLPGRERLRSGQPVGLRPARSDRKRRRGVLRGHPLGRLPLPEPPGRRAFGRVPDQLCGPARPAAPGRARSVPGGPGKALRRRKPEVEAAPHADRRHRVAPGRSRA